MRNLNLQRRHFEWLAFVLADLPADIKSRTEVVEHFRRACRTTNGLFDSERFVAACNPDRETVGA